MRKPFWFALTLVILIPAVTLALRHWPRPDPRVLPDGAVDPSVDYSNILPVDYVGPQACAQCHKKRFEQWSSHPHSKMNQLPGSHSVQGDFSGQVLDLSRGTVTFSQEGDAYRMTLKRDGQFLRRYEVTRTVGSRFMQFYVGRQLEGPDPPSSPLYQEHMLPFAYWITIGRWLPKPFFDPDGPELLKDGVPLVEGIDHIHDIRPFNQVCMNCHNTFAYSYRIFHPMFVGFPAATVSTAIGPLSKELSSFTPVLPRVSDFEKVNGRIDPQQHLVTVGISCESCHFGGREHAVEGRPIRFAPTSPLLKLTPHDPERPVTGARRDPATVNGICTQCHSGNTRFFPNGSAQCNSREGFDFLNGACASKLTCVKCHDPHVAGPPSGGPSRQEHVDLCTTCHQQYQEPATAAAHSRHESDVDCLDCHMPRQTLGLDELVRTHRITVPVEQSMVDKASANACNLCHLDKSLRWTVTELEKGWGQSLDTTAAAKMLDQPLGDVWLHSEEQSLRVLATQSFARSLLGKDRLPDLLQALNDPEPLNRVFALKAVERVAGRKVDRTAYSLTAPPAARQRQIDRVLKP